MPGAAVSVVTYPRLLSLSSVALKVIFENREVGNRVVGDNGDDNCSLQRFNEVVLASPLDISNGLKN